MTRLQRILLPGRPSFIDVSGRVEAPSTQPNAQQFTDPRTNSEPDLMKLIYLDCNSGISGDMLLAALIDAGADHEVIQSKIDSLGVKDVRLKVSNVTRHGFRARKVEIEHPPQHAHRHLSDILEILERSNLASRPRATAEKIFRRLAEAEARVHGTSLEKVHFHEVGAIDSIADIVGVAVAMDLLEIERVVSSHVPTGTGTIKIAHGIVTVPAPATAELLKGIPIVESDIQAELTTPTGAAFLATLVDSFGPLPSLKIETIGYGAGNRELSEQANLIRVLTGTLANESSRRDSDRDQVTQLETNLDNVTGELVGHCVGLLEQAGALDVCLSPIQMKKNRPGTKLSLLCRTSDAGQFKDILFRETHTLGIRETLVNRTVLPRRPLTLPCPFGQAEGKVFRLPDGSIRYSLEYDAARSLASTNDLPLMEIYRTVQDAFQQLASEDQWPDE